MIKLLFKETFKEIELEHKLTLRYAISNYGRFVSFKENILEGRLLKCSRVEGFRVFKYKTVKNGVTINKHYFLYKLVAENFLRKPGKHQKHLIHLDHVSDNDMHTNLKWVTKDEMIMHNCNSPKVIEARKKLIEHNKFSDGKKLTVTQVIRIKRLINDPNRKTRMKIIAKRFGISPMQLYRIKTGENWAHIK